MNITRFTIGNVALVAGLAAIGCQGSTKPEQPAEPVSQAGTLVAGSERDLHVISERAIAAFRDDRGVYRAGHLTHDVKVADGVIELTPFHVDDSATRVEGGKLALRTGSITSDGERLDGDRSERITNGIVEITRGEIVETVTNREDGIEQAWRFDSAPTIAGDVTVAVAVIGHRFITDNTSGLHFQSPDGLGFRYSDAVWIEANGTQWPIESRFVDGQIVMTVPADVVANTSFPAVLDPTITPEVAVDAPVNGGTGAQATNASVAFDGTNYLVVWADRRLSADHDIFGTRVSQAGAILDANGITIGASAGPQLNPAVTFAGGTFVVAWEDFKVSGGTEADIAAARVSSGGVATSLGTVAGTAASETEPALGTSGSTALLAWTAGAADVNGAIFNGTTFGAPAPIAASANAEITPAVAGNPAGNFLVAFSEGVTNVADLRGQFVTPAGALSGAAFDISLGAGRQFDPSATFDGTNYALSWTVNSAGVNVFGGRVSTAGVVLDTHLEGTLTVGGVAISTAADNQDQSKIACAAAGCIIEYRDRRNLAVSGFDVRAQRVTSAFVLDGAEFVISGEGGTQAGPTVTTNGTDYFTAWHDQRDNHNLTIFGARVTSTGTVSDANGIPLVTGNNRETTPSVGHAGSTHVVAWTDSRSGSADVNFVRFSSTTKLDATARTASGATFAQSSPSVSASGGTSMYVVWADTRGGVDTDVFGTKINTDGTVTNTAGIPIVQAATDQLVPTVQSNQNGTAALVVWQDRRNNNFDIMGALLDASGNVVQGDIVICGAAGDQTRPTLAFDAQNQQWMVVWSDARNATDVDVFAARVSIAGAVLDQDGVNITTGAANGQFAPVIAFTGGIYLTVWEDRRNDGNGDVFGTRLRGGASLQILDPAGVGYGGTAGAQTSISIAQNIGSFLIAWADSRNAATTGLDIFGIQVGADGEVGEAEFVVSGAVGDESSPVVGDSSTVSVSRIAYQKVRADLQTIRVATRLITTTRTTGSTCSTDTQCGAGGFCVDGKCCDAACGGNNIGDCQGCKNTLTGQPDGTCAPLLSGKICRRYADTFCDRLERCDGTNIVCPEDIGRRQGQTCDIAGGGTGTCPADDVTGAPHVCQ
jgi:hypothetical protein